jgi:hypothetical protein
MSEDKKTVGRAFAAAIDMDLHCRIYVGAHGIRCQASNGEVHTANLPLDWDELQTVLGDYATVTPKPKPAQWVITLSDVLRPWEPLRESDPLTTKVEAADAAVGWARRISQASHGDLRPYAFDGYVLIRATRDSNAIHYRLTWRQETEGER